MEVGQSVILYGQTTNIDHIDEVEEIVTVNPSIIVPDIEYQKDNFPLEFIKLQIKKQR